mgnify:CR=1 FL=1
MSPNIVKTFTFFERASTNVRTLTIFDNDTGTIEMKNVLWWRFLGEDRDHIQSIYPDGGPMFSVNDRFGNYKITKFTQIDEIGSSDDDEFTLVVQKIHSEQIR